MTSIPHRPPALPRQTPAALPRVSARWGIGAVTLLLILYPLFFFRLGGWGLIDPDEGRYSEVPREMLAHHDWITPTLNSVKFFDKPPLLYWGIAASYSVFGLHEWVARLVPVLAALLGLAMTWALGRRMFGPRVGWLSALILATSLLWPLMARAVLTDMLVSSLCFCALGFWWLGHTATTPRQSRAFWGFWIALALGVLAKGPVAVVLVGGTITLYLALCRQWKMLGAMKWGAGVPLFLAIAAPWFVLVAARNPEFNHFFWYEQHIGRFLGDRAIRDHVYGPFYLLELLPLIFFPWSVWVPAAIAAGWKRVWPARSQKQRATVFLACGCVFIVGFFSASDSKIVTYILPVLPMLALLMGAYFDRLIAAKKSGVPFAVSTAFLALLLLVGAAAAFFLGPKNLRPLGVSGDWAYLLGALLGAWALALVVVAWRVPVRATLCVTAGGFTLVFTAAISLICALAPALTTRPLFALLPSPLSADAKVVTYGFFQSPEFYAQRRVYVEGAPHELQAGMKHLSPAEKRRWFFNGPLELRVLMSAQTPVYCFLQVPPSEEKRTMAVLGNAAGEIARNARFVLIGNRAALQHTRPVR